MEILEHIRAYIETERLFDPQEPVLVAVSGGADSLCLMDGLRRLDYPILAAHLDHQLRPGSASDAEAVEKICRGLGVRLIRGAEDADELARAGRSIEEAARTLRYRFLVRAAQENGIRTIATGHTYDDQAETILMHFLRGAGPSGLRGMRPRTNLGAWPSVDAVGELWLVRPLLVVTREQTQAYCRQVGLTPVDDPTNLDPSYTRNRVRLELLPHLKTFNPQIEANLNRMGEMMAGIEALIDEMVRSEWSHVVQNREDGSLLIRKPNYSDQPLALQREIMRKAIFHMLPEAKDLSYEIIEGGREFILKGNTGARHTLMGRLELLVTRQGALLYMAGDLLTFPDLPQLRDDAPRRVSAPCMIPLGSGWRIGIERRPAPEAGWQELIDPQDDFSAAIDERRARGVLEIRPPRPGDRFRPFGMEGTVKLSKFLIDKGVPEPARSRWPLLLKGDRILWVVGLRMAEEGRLDDESVQVLRMKLLPPEGGE